MQNLRPSVFLSLLILGMSSAQVSVNYTATIDAINAESAKAQAAQPSSIGDDLAAGIFIPISFSVNGTNKTAYLNLGLSALPAATFVCGEIPILNAIGCHICSLDCLLAHNKYGGRCGTAPNPLNPTQRAGNVCLCYDEPFANQTVPTAEQSCGPVFNSEIDVAVDEALTIGIYKREQLGLCVGSAATGPNLFNLSGPQGNGYNSDGCIVDCCKNHQYATGACNNQIPVSQFPGQVNLVQKPFCGCYYGNVTASGCM